MTLPSQLPYDESYWVVPGFFIAGHYPGGYDELETRRSVQKLIQCGVCACIDLSQSSDHKYPYSDILFEEAYQYEREVQYFSFPIPDWKTPDKKFMVNILDQIDTCIQSQKTVYVHCIAGIGRTGTVVGAYLVRHGTDPDQVLEKIGQLRANVPSAWTRSPESDDQIDFIQHWKKGK